ncbi:hypothetical protein [Sulfuricystis multivorans]|uniref:hypothetical protein n=1 Tax=Sulfuricystis multivorans TaxID=2211108 RepID=UPI000F84A03F|nr:hypothetical protein [Sulfuricystis multivorans]
MNAKGIVSLLALLPAMTFAAGDGTDYRDLLMKAMNAKDGKASVEVTGRTAEMIRQQINRPNARVVAEVTTVANLKQEGCKRFNIRYYTPGTLLPMTDGSTRMLDMSVKLNMCQNGLPPGVDSEYELEERMVKDSGLKPDLGSPIQQPAAQQ